MAKFTTRNIKTLTTQGKRVRDVRDGQCESLYLTIQQSGVRSWTVRYRLDGRQRRYTLGRATAIDVMKARKLAQAILRKVAEGVDPQAEKVAARTGETTDAFLDQAIRFVETYARKQNKSWIAQARLLGLSLNKAARRNPDLERHWAIIPGSPVARWQKRSVASITKREIVEAVDAATERGPIVANRVHATLTRVFSWAVEKGVIEINPALGTKAPSAEKPRDRVLTTEELSAVWWAAEKLRPPFGAFVRLLILTGARRNEISGMTADELAAGVWTLPAGRSKTQQPNALPLPTQALEIIAQLPQHGLLFTTTGRTPISGFSKMKRVLDAAVIPETRQKKAIPPWTIHDIRRSVATGMGELGIEPHVVELILGHRKIMSGVAAVYNRSAYADQKKAALQEWANEVQIAAMTG